jgi:hypothetical protein
LNETVIGERFGAVRGVVGIEGGFAELGHAAERAVSTVAAFVADAAQAPSRLGDAAALLTADGRLGTVWQVMAPFAGLKPSMADNQGRES